ncbi:MAG: hypothetical protein CMK56_00305 [Proteobacteria bacterium]|nr:hypothetical protein [Pseudomonadota bacterium]
MTFKVVYIFLEKKMYYKKKTIPSGSSLKNMVFISAFWVLLLRQSGFLMDKILNRLDFPTFR